MAENYPDVLIIADGEPGLTLNFNAASVDDVTTRTFSQIIESYVGRGFYVRLEVSTSDIKWYGDDRSGPLRYRTLLSEIPATDVDRLLGKYSPPVAHIYLYDPDSLIHSVLLAEIVAARRESVEA